jgi:hypothetical protein
MNVSNFHKKPVVPATVANLDLAVVVAALVRHGCNCTDAALELKVPASDLRRLMWANPGMQDQAFEIVEARLDTAEKNIHEALGRARRCEFLCDRPHDGVRDRRIQVD